nr:hypothetical protein [Tanacetum cinerariifolium]
MVVMVPVTHLVPIHVRLALIVKVWEAEKQEGEAWEVAGMEDRMSSSRWTDIEKGIEQHFAKRYSNNKHNLKRDYWNVKPGETRDVEAIRSRPPPSVEQSDWDKPIKFWLDPKHVTRVAKDVENRARDTIFCCYGCRSLSVLR